MKFFDMIFNQMNIQEFISTLRDKGLSDLDISNRTKLTAVQIFRLRTGKTKKPNPSTCKALADAFDYELKYESGEPHFYPKGKAERAGSARGDPSDIDEAMKIKAYLNELGIGSLEELKQVFMDAGAVFGRKENEITEVLRNLRALDAIRKLAKKDEVKG